MPVTLLARQLLYLGRWLACWRMHWIAPIFKKGATSDPANYRGVYLTTTLPKIVERVIGTVLGDYLEESEAFGTMPYK